PKTRHVIHAAPDGGIARQYRAYCCRRESEDTSAPTKGLGSICGSNTIEDLSMSCEQRLRLSELVREHFQPAARRSSSARFSPSSRGANATINNMASERSSISVLSLIALQCTFL